MPNTRKSIATSLRWAGRIIASILLIGAIIMFVDGLINPERLSMTGERIIFYILELVGFTAIVLSWRNGIGASILLIICAFGILINVSFHSDDSLIWISYGLPNLVSGVSILISWILMKEKHPQRS
jgi:hypothetical protein